MQIEITNKDVVKKWNKHESVWSIELGGIGPGYEQAIQEFTFDILSYLVKKKVDLESLIDGKEFSELYEHISMLIAKDRGLSGAQYGVAKSTAYQFYRYGYSEMMNKAPKDREILVSKANQPKENK